MKQYTLKNTYLVAINTSQKERDWSLDIITLIIINYQVSYMHNFTL